LAQFFCEFSCPNRREFIRKFFEFAPRGAFQARIPGDFSPFERNRASVFAETLLWDVASHTCRAASLSIGRAGLLRQKGAAVEFVLLAALFSVGCRNFGDFWNRKRTTSDTGGLLPN
jgi:hypothetical protein